MYLESFKIHRHSWSVVDNRIEYSNSNLYLLVDYYRALLYMCSTVYVLVDPVNDNRDKPSNIILYRALKVLKLILTALLYNKASRKAYTTELVYAYSGRHKFLLADDNLPWVSSRLLRNKV